jgi:hypothetical protein
MSKPFLAQMDRGREWAHEVEKLRIDERNEKHLEKGKTPESDWLCQGGHCMKAKEKPKRLGKLFKTISRVAVRMNAWSMLPSRTYQGKREPFSERVWRTNNLNVSR